MVVALVAALVLAPREATMGDIQRLFYFHMPSAWIALGPAFTVVFALSIAYLVTGKMVYDRWAGASAEIGVIFTTITLMTGPMWAKPVWGVYWTWEPRLTTTLVLWFIYVGYLLLRSIAGEGPRRARLSAVYGIVGWIDVPIVFLSIWLWRTIHPRILGSGGFDMDSRMVGRSWSVWWRSRCSMCVCWCCARGLWTWRRRSPSYGRACAVLTVEEAG